jgi:hypothetical protein
VGKKESIYVFNAKNFSKELFPSVIYVEEYPLITKLMIFVELVDP